MRFTEVEPDTTQLAEVLQSYGRPVVLIPQGSVRFGHMVPWDVRVELTFDDHAPTLTPAEWKQQVIARLDALFSDLRSVGWEISDDIKLNFRYVYDRPQLVGDMHKPKLGRPAKELCTLAKAAFNLIPFWGELLADG